MFLPTSAAAIMGQQGRPQLSSDGTSPPAGLRDTHSVGGASARLEPLAVRWLPMTWDGAFPRRTSARAPAVTDARDKRSSSVKSMRRVRLLANIASAYLPAPRRQALTLPLLEAPPRTTVQRASLANARRHASTWSSRSAKRASFASRPKTLTIISNSLREYTS